MKRRPVYDPAHDALWTAIRRLNGTVILLAFAILAVALAVAL